MLFMSVVANAVGFVCQAWRVDLPWIKVRGSHSPFTKCGLCEFLKGCVGKAEDESVRSMLLNRIGRHYEFAASQRLVLSNIWQKCQFNPRERTLISIDKMDQQKTMLPRVQHLMKTLIMKGAPRLVCGVVGAIIPGVFAEPVLTTVFDDCSHGGDMQASAILQLLILIKMKLGALPKTFVVHADNAQKETKNTICLFFFTWLLANLEDSIMQSIEIVFLMTGHTHDLVDAFFGQISTALGDKDVARALLL